MKPKSGFFLLLLIAVSVLSVYSCLAATPAELTEKILNNTYRFSPNHITNIQIFVMNAEIYFYTEPKQDEMIVQINGAAAEVTKQEECVVVKNENGKECRVDFYLPTRFFDVLIQGDKISVYSECEMHGTMTIQAGCLEACFEDYCGGYEITSKVGTITIENGLLQKESHITFSEKGNLYLNTKITDTIGISSLYTEQGIIKIKTAFLDDNTFFEVIAIAEDGSYAPLEPKKRKNTNCHKIKVISPNGIVKFVN